MKGRFVSAMLSIALLIGIMSLQLPAEGAQDVVKSTQLFENIDYQKSANIRVIIDGKLLVFDVNPQLVDGRTLVPMRNIFEALGLKVNWDAVTETAIGTNADNTFLFVIGSNKVMVNNQEKSLDVPASIIDGRTMIPLRFLSENMGYHVVWIESSNLILIGKSDIIEWRYEGFEEIPPYKEFEYKYVNGVKGIETRYTGKNHEVKIVTLYSADGRIVPNVLDFNLSDYGGGWYQESPFAGKTYWVDLDIISGGYNDSRFYDPKTFTPLRVNLLRDSAPAGNYLKVKIEEHYFALDTWNKLDASNSALSVIKDEKLLDGKEISSDDTIFRVTINDKYSGLILLGNLIDTLLTPGEDQIYTIFEEDPRTIFDWPDSTWSRLKGENPWTGMTKDMLLVQLLTKPDQTTVTETRFSVYELWVYEYDYTDAIYFFDDGVLTDIR